MNAMTQRLKQAANWTIFAASAIYGLWSFSKFFPVLFNLGENETAQTTLSLLAFGLAPFPASLLALRWRKTAAFIFCGVAILLASLFLGDRGAATIQLIGFASSLLIFAAFYSITDFLRWPTIISKARSSR